MTYTDQEFANTYLGFGDVSETEVVQAENDLDDLALGAYKDRQTEEPFRKVDLNVIKTFQANGLARACCEQIRYRRLMGAEFFVRPQRDSGQIEGVQFQGTLPHISPRALSILADVGLVKKLGKPSISQKITSLEDIGWE
jgi:hypothetical protein